MNGMGVRQITAWEGEGANTSSPNFRFVPLFAHTALPCVSVLPRVPMGILVWYLAFVGGSRTNSISMSYVA